LPEIDDETQRRWMKEAVLELRSFYQPRPSIELLLTEDGIGVAKGFNLNPTNYQLIKDVLLKYSSIFLFVFSPPNGRWTYH
jgi:hypothetical protein